MGNTLTRSALAVIAFTALLSLSIVQAQAGQVYKWVDEKGVVTFGDKSQRPESAPSEAVKIDTYVPPEKPAASDDIAAKTEKDAKDKEKKPPEEAKMPVAEKRKLCAQARAELASIQVHARVREADAKGNLSYLSEEQKQTRIKAINKDIREFCR